MTRFDHGIESGSVWVRRTTGAKVCARPLSGGDSLYAENVETGRQRWWRAGTVYEAVEDGSFWSDTTDRSTVFYEDEPRPADALPLYRLTRVRHLGVVS